jgi:hypothetical protein
MQAVLDGPAEPPGQSGLDGWGGEESSAVGDNLAFQIADRLFGAFQSPFTTSG